MKPIWKDVLLALFLGLVLPWLLLNLIIHFRAKPGAGEEQAKQSQHEETEATQITKLTMYLRYPDGTVTEMDLDTYLTGVILAELPASFEQEAKKAQSIAARTFTWKAVTTGGKHGDGSVCTDSTCCQAYVDPDDYTGTAEAVLQAREAVQATSGCVLTYNGELIEATYFSCSGGSTEDAVAVWGTNVPYLQATESPGEERATHYTDTRTFTAEEFQSALGVSLRGSPSTWLGMTTYTAGGGVATMEIGDKSYKGTQLRTLLGLKSTAFTMTVEGDSITVTTRGYGHRVGMSQYGADAMAAGGSTYAEILTHYYQGVKIDKIGDLG